MNGCERMRDIQDHNRRVGNITRAILGIENVPTAYTPLDFLCRYRDDVFVVSEEIYEAIALADEKDFGGKTISF